MTRNKKLVRLMALTVAATTVATAVPAYAAFDAAYYAKQNPDVVAVVGNTPKALEQHYNTFGKNEGRAASADDLSNSPLRQLFDAELYAKLYPDVVAVFGNNADSLFKHFMTFGINEGRKINPYFDVNAYKAAYPDLAAAFGDNIALYYQHFANLGQKEHRTQGGFPSENILPGGTKAAAASGGSSGGSSGGGSSSSGGSSSGAVTPSNGLPTNVAANPKAVASANAAVTQAVTKAKNDGVTSQKAKDELVASAQSTLKAAQAVNAQAQADKATAQAEFDKADEELNKAEAAVESSKNDVVKTFDDNNTFVAAVGAKQTAYYAALEDLNDKKDAQEAKAIALANAQAAAKTAQAEYDTALKNAKDTYVAVSGNPASYIENKKPADVIDALETLAGGKTVTQTETAVNTLIQDKDGNDIAIIGADGKVDDSKYQAAVKKATDDAKADNLALYQVEYLNNIIKAADSYDADGNIKASVVAKLGNYGVNAAGWVVADKNTNAIADTAALPNDPKLATLTSTVIGSSVKIGGKTVTEQEAIDVEAAKKGIDDKIKAYDAAVSGAALSTAQTNVSNAATDLGNKEAAKSGADDDVEAAETALSNADKAVKDAEKARDEEYEKEGVAGNAELKARDAAQANVAKETYELSKATEAAQTAQDNADAAYTNYDDATKVNVVPAP